jgi:uncharacterized protein (TIGR03435 family)
MLSTAILCVLVHAGVAIWPPTLYAQQINLRFEVASVKRAAPGTDGGGMYYGADDVRAVNAPIGMVLVFAYGLSRYDWPLGLSGWAERETFDIAAKAGRRATMDERRAMMRALLADRFGLKAHLEERQLDVLALVRTKPGTPLPRSLEAVICPTQASQNFPPCTTRAGAGELITTGLTMTMLADRLRVLLGKRVIDQTALVGPYKFSLKYATPDSSGAIDGADVTTALTEQLGLKLVPRKAAVSVLVVDRIHPPTPD